AGLDTMIIIKDPGPPQKCYNNNLHKSYAVVRPCSMCFLQFKSQYKNRGHKRAIFEKIERTLHTL
ncbi:MAG: hypothetical protein PVI90_00640, partial [Desulfobacteraceae bacterium]